MTKPERENLIILKIAKNFQKTSLPKNDINQMVKKIPSLKQL